ncbi:MAG: MBL fold metallo-hydrolase [Bacteroidia bacterium]|nr:MBL fold metallo-hydrolase [Bacteroidia bacterium]
MQLEFYGAARMVTGSKHLLATPKGTKILLDCGLVQGHLDNRDELNHNFGFNPREVDYLILSHAHIDHSGLIPRLVRLGFKGLIFCTPATKSLCELMLMDSAFIQSEDLKFTNKRRRKKGMPLLEPLYDITDVEHALKLFEDVGYDEHLQIDEEISLCFNDAGHLLGSAIVNLDITTGEEEMITITFSGDVGRYNDPILRDPQAFRQCDYLICESTYGNRLHPLIKDAEGELLSIVKHTCIDKKGKLIIPAFSVDRTQEIIYILDEAANAGKLPDIKVYVDSPLSVKATDVIRKHQECFRKEFIAYIAKDPEPFGFKNLIYITDVEQSKKLNDSTEPCIIISASGMAEAGRVKHHIMNNIEDPKNTILLVGYCTPESLGGHLKNGDKEVRIFAETYPVKAAVRSLEYYSAHADYSELLKWLECQDATKIKKVFLVHGEYEVQQIFREKLLEKGFGDVVIPARGESFNIS